MKTKIIGIYLLTCTINNKKYVGESIDIIKRLTSHKNTANRLKNDNTELKKYPLYYAIIKYGWENFKSEIIEKHDVDDKKYRLERELYFINKYNCWVNVQGGYNCDFYSGYNTAINTDTLTNNPNKIDIGNKISKTKKELNKSWIYKGNKTKCVNADKLNTFLQNGWIIGRIEFTQIHKDNISTVLKDKWKNGYTHKPEAFEIMSNTFKGKKHTEETKEQMRNNSKDKYTLNWFINKYGESLGSQKYTEKCQKLKDRKMATGLDWFISRYGEIDGLKWFTYKEENIKNRYYIWVNNNIDMIIIKRSEKKKYIEDGWFVGMLKNKN